MLNIKLSNIPSTSITNRQSTSSYRKKQTLRNSSNQNSERVKSTELTPKKITNKSYNKLTTKINSQQLVNHPKNPTFQYQNLLTQDNVNARNMQCRPHSNIIKNNSQQSKNSHQNQYVKKTSYLLGLSSYPTKVKQKKPKSCQNSQQKIFYKFEQGSRSKLNKINKVNIFDDQTDNKQSHKNKIHSTTTNTIKNNKKTILHFDPNEIEQIKNGEKNYEEFDYCKNKKNINEPNIITIDIIGTQPQTYPKSIKSKNFFNQRNKTEKNAESNPGKQSKIKSKSKHIQSKSRSKQFYNNPNLNRIKDKFKIKQNENKILQKWDESKVPYSTKQIQETYCHYLTLFEQNQIKQYKCIYYLGHNCLKKKTQFSENMLKKNGKQKQQLHKPFDFTENNLIITPKYNQNDADSSVSYLMEHQQKQFQPQIKVVQIKEQVDFDNAQKEYQYLLHDHIAYRYQIIQKMGKGSYGQVLKVFDHKRKQFSALKIITNKQKFNQQAFIQINILTQIKQSDVNNESNVVKIKDFIIFRQHVCIIFQLLSQNLYQLIVRNNFNGLNQQLIRRFAIQILTALLFLKKHQIIHCDLKPENILLREYNKSGLKIIDLGSSCYKNQTKYTYIQSRYYRAPEITLGIKYSYEIDMWSTGCILGELFTGIPLFPGENEREQMKYFVKTLGFPSRQFTQKGERSELFFDNQNNPFDFILNTKSIDHFQQPLRERIKNDKFCDFLQGFLRWDPKQRFTPIMALNHQWIKIGLPAQIKKILPSEKEDHLIIKKKQSVSLTKKINTKSIQKHQNILESQRLKKDDQGSKIRIKKNSQQLLRKSKELRNLKD